jgi:hypothetical protein
MDVHLMNFKIQGCRKENKIGRQFDYMTKRKSIMVVNLGSWKKSQAKSWTLYLSMEPLQLYFLWGPIATY